jgi:anti-sigma factor RsiW
MRECSNIDIQDRLPDFVAGTLAASEAAEVSAHLTVCAACADDVVLLRRVRALPSAPVALDVGAIVGRLPRVTASSGGDDVPRLRVITGGLDVAPSMRSHRSSRRRVSGWRMAAAIGVIAVGGLTTVIARTGGLGMLQANRPGGLALDDSGTAALVAMAPGSGTVTPAVTAVAVSYGDLGDYSDEELALMLDRLERWDGTASTDPLPGVPLLPASGVGPDDGED